MRNIKNKFSKLCYLKRLRNSQNTFTASLGGAKNNIKKKLCH